MPRRRAVDGAAADDMFTPAKVAVELAYLERPIVARVSSGPMAGPGCWRCMPSWSGMMRRWRTALAPLALGALRTRFTRISCRMLTYPIRTGAHFNTRLRARPGGATGRCANDRDTASP